MKRSMVYVTTLLAAYAVAASGCAMPGEAEFPHLANCVPQLHHHDNLPPAEVLMHPGPGVEGPGPGVLGTDGMGGMGGGMGPGGMGPGGIASMGMGPGAGMIAGGPGGMPQGPNGVMQACCLMGGGGYCGPNGGMLAGGGPGSGNGATSQIAFISPEGMSVTWDIGGVGQFDSQALIAPGRYNFPQGAIYRLKITNIQGRPGVELYPTLEIGPARPRTEAYLAHNAIPFQLTEEDLDQVLSGNFVTKVIYLPDPQYQELALAGVETLVSTRLDPGVDPIVEADRRGSIMAIIRIGNKDLELPGSNNGDRNVTRAGYVQQACYCEGMPGPIYGSCATGNCPTGPNYSMPPQFVAGVTAPEYGMPSCGTPIGLPGPPHIPLGIQAGLQRHTMTNYTCMNVPGPTASMDICVKQKPGFTYPKPVSHVSILEENHAWPLWFHQPCEDHFECVKEPGCQDTNSPVGDCNCPTN